MSGIVTKLTHVLSRGHLMQQLTSCFSFQARDSLLPNWK